MDLIRKLNNVRKIFKIEIFVNRNKEFTMFDSFFEHPDLISLDDYLGQDIIQLIIRTDPRMCNLASLHFLSYSIIFLTFFLYFIKLI